jgi:prepilin peptidase CpaA
MSLTIVDMPAAVVGSGVLLAAVTDLWKFKVHNYLTLPLLFSGMAYHAAASGMPGLGASVLGAAFGFFVLFTFYLLGGFGGGDVKLMAAVGAWLGLPLTFYVFVFSSLAAGIYALVLIATHGHWRRTWVNFQIACHKLIVIGRHLGGDDRVELQVSSAERRKNCIPFAAMMAIGVFCTLAWLYWQADLGILP